MGEPLPHLSARCCPLVICSLAALVSPVCHFVLLMDCAFILLCGGRRVSLHEDNGDGDGLPDFSFEQTWQNTELMLEFWSLWGLIGVRRRAAVESGSSSGEEEEGSCPVRGDIRVIKRIMVVFDLGICAFSKGETGDRQKKYFWPRTKSQTNGAKSRTHWTKCLPELFFF